MEAMTRRTMQQVGEGSEMFRLATPALAAVLPSFQNAQQAMVNVITALHGGDGAAVVCAVQSAAWGLCSASWACVRAASRSAHDNATWTRTPMQSTVSMALEMHIVFRSAAEEFCESLRAMVPSLPQPARGRAADQMHALAESLAELRQEAVFFRAFLPKDT